MKKLNFRIIHRQVSDDEKKKRIKQYNEFTGEHITFEQLKDEPMYDDYIDMKCSKCGYAQLEEADIILECFDKHSEPYPCINCPHCNDFSYIPNDVFTQLNNLPFKEYK